MRAFTDTGGKTRENAVSRYEAWRKKKLVPAIAGGKLARNVRRLFFFLVYEARLLFISAINGYGESRGCFFVMGMPGVLQVDGF